MKLPFKLKAICQTIHFKIRATTPLKGKISLLSKVELTEENLGQADCGVLTTNHSVFDVQFIVRHARLVVDLRNMVKEG